jgi:hypothetical protein
MQPRCGLAAPRSPHQWSPAAQAAHRLVRDRSHPTPGGGGQQTWAVKMASSRRFPAMQGRLPRQPDRGVCMQHTCIMVVSPCCRLQTPKLATCAWFGDSRRHSSNAGHGDGCCAPEAILPGPPASPRTSGSGPSGRSAGRAPASSEDRSHAPSTDAPSVLWRSGDHWFDPLMWHGKIKPVCADWGAVSRRKHLLGLRAANVSRQGHTPRLPWCPAGAGARSRVAVDMRTRLRAPGCGWGAVYTPLRQAAPGGGDAGSAEIAERRDRGGSSLLQRPAPPRRRPRRRQQLCPHQAPWEVAHSQTTSENMST